MKINLEKNLFLQIIQWGLTKPDGFTYSEFNENLKFEGWKRSVTDNHFEQAYRNHEAMSHHNIAIGDTVFLHIGPRNSYNEATARYIINYNAQFNYIDFEELQFARKSAGEARLLAIIAILVAVVAPLIVLTQTQTVKIEVEQLKSVIEAFKGASQ